MAASTEPADPWLNDALAREVGVATDEGAFFEGPAPEYTAAPAQPPSSLINLHLENIDLEKAMALLAVQSGREIEASSQAGGALTADLSGVTFNEALDSLLLPAGFDSIECDSVVYIFTQEPGVTARAGEEREWRAISTNSLDARATAKFIRPILSAGGEVFAAGDAPARTPMEVLEATGDFGTTVFVYDFPDNCDEAGEFMASLDTRATHAREASEFLGGVFADGTGPEDAPTLWSLMTNTSWNLDPTGPAVTNAPTDEK
jgi:hypothetical protein